MNLLYSFSNAFFPYHNTSNKEESYAIEFAVARGDSMEDPRESLNTEVPCHIKYESITLPKLTPFPALACIVICKLYKPLIRLREEFSNFKQFF